MSTVDWDGKTTMWGNDMARIKAISCLAGIVLLNIVGCATQVSPAPGEVAAGPPTGGQSLTPVLPMNQSLRLAVDDGGSGGLPVLFIHSLAGGTVQWSAQLEHLRLSRRAVAVTVRGHPGSPMPDNDEFGMAMMAADIEQIANDLDLERFVLAGHSAGGGIAIAYASARPQRVAGLLLVDPIGDMRKIEREEIERFIGMFESADYAQNIESYWASILRNAQPSSRAIVLRDMRATPQATVVGILRAASAYDLSDALRQYPGPVTIVTTVLNDAPVSLHKLFPHHPQRRIEGTSHWPQLDRPGDFNAILDRFLDWVGKPLEE